MNAAILSIGTELTTGQCLDTNSQWLSIELSKIGVPVSLHVTIADDVEAMVRAIQYAMDANDVVIITGGLGPTVDDLTREAVAKVLEQPLEERADALAQITEIFKKWQRPMPESNKVQALIPRGCRVLPNSCGTAPGFVHEEAGRFVFALPGVPREMKVMFEAEILPAISRGGISACLDSRQLRCFGMGEAILGEKIKDLMARGRNPSVGTTASGSIVTIRIVAQGKDRSEVHKLLDRESADLRERLGPVIFGEGDATLQEAVGRLLIEQGKTVATAESCTGGMLAARFTDVSGSSAYFLRGFVTYSNHAKSELLGVPASLIEAEGAVSEAVARAMADGCRRVAQTDYALAITGVAGPTGGSVEKPVGLVYIGLADASGVEIKRFLFGEWMTRDEIRDRSCKTALNWLRLRLLGINL